MIGKVSYFFNFRFKLKKVTKKENYNLHFIATENNDIRKYYKSLINSKEEVLAEVEQYEIDKELEAADKEVSRAINLKTYKKEIMNKPRK